MKSNKKNRICLEKIIFYCDELDMILKKHSYKKDEFMSSSEMQYACGMCIVQIGELVSNLDDEFKAINNEVPWRVIKATRNIYVHQYGSVDLDQVWNTITENIPTLKKQLKDILCKIM